jgi:hypothetical protein
MAAALLPKGDHLFLQIHSPGMRGAQLTTGEELHDGFRSHRIPSRMAGPFTAMARMWRKDLALGYDRLSCAARQALGKPWGAP